MHQAKALSEAVKSAEADADAAEAELDTLLRRLPNIIQPEVPPGGEEDYVGAARGRHAARLRGRGLRAAATTWSSASG